MLRADKDIYEDLKLKKKKFCLHGLYKLFQLCKG